MESTIFRFDPASISSGMEGCIPTGNFRIFEDPAGMDSQKSAIHFQRTYCRIIISVDLQFPVFQKSDICYSCPLGNREEGS